MASVSDFSVNPADLKATAESIRGRASRLQGQYQQMFSRVEALSKVWKSADGDKFKSDMLKFRPDFEALNRALMTSAEGLEQAAAIYIKAQGL